MARETEALRSGYDAVADDYARKFASELDHKPFDREVLDGFAGELRGAGRVADVGCGPGQIARYLRDRGVDACGVDLSPAMVARAHELHPATPFDVGDLRALPFEDASLAGVTAFYSLIHVPPDAVPAAMSELHRVLRPQGLLLLAFHLGEGTTRLREWWGKPVSIDFFFFSRAEMERHLRDTGFEVVEVRERGPYPEVEADTHRAYIRARKPA